jgi:hypothetical protein
MAWDKKAKASFAKSLSLFDESMDNWWLNADVAL